MTNHWSLSQLTYARPDIWERALKLANDTTGIRYVEKHPLPDGTIYACGSISIVPPLTERQDLENRIERLTRNLEWLKRNPSSNNQNDIDERTRRKEELEDKLRDLPPVPDTPKALSVVIPSGAMEWLLHEVGHWVVASNVDRLRPNYGDSRDIEAWAFEEAVLSHLGPARDFAPPTQRDGPAFIAGPIPDWAFRRVDKRLTDGDIEIEPFQLLWAEWVAWGHAQDSDAPWRKANM